MLLKLQQELFTYMISPYLAIILVVVKKCLAIHFLDMRSVIGCAQVLWSSVLQTRRNSHKCSGWSHIYNLPRQKTLNIIPIYPKIVLENSYFRFSMTKTLWQTDNINFFDIQHWTFVEINDQHKWQSVMGESILTKH